MTLPSGYETRHNAQGRTVLYFVPRFGKRVVVTVAESPLAIAKAVRLHQLTLECFDFGQMRRATMAPRAFWKLMSARLDLEPGLSAHDRYRVKRRVMRSALRDAEDLRQLALDLSPAEQ